MKATHRLYKWWRYYGAHKFERGLHSYRARIKKDGTIMYWVGFNRLGLGAHPPHISYFYNEKDLKTKRTGQHRDSFGKIKKFQIYFTLEKI